MTTDFSKAAPECLRWAEGLIKQLPVHHDGRNSWLMNFGHGQETDDLRLIWEGRSGRPFPSLQAGAGQADAVAWQDISSAPKDRWFLGYWPERSEPAERFAATIWDEQATDGPRFLDIADSMNGIITHWMPLPLHPPISGPGPAHPPAASARIAELTLALENLAFHSTAACDPGVTDMQRDLTRMSIARARAALAGGRT